MLDESKGKNPHALFDETKLSPMDGSPQVSANCWEAVLSAVDLRAKEKNSERVRVLEWGSGNSTISFVKKGLNLPHGLEIISIDHATSFFPFLAESVIKTLTGAPQAGELNLSWNTVHGPIIPLSQFRRVYFERKKFKNPSLTLQILLGNRSLEYIDQQKPTFHFSLLRITKQLFKITLTELGYLVWLAKGVWRAIGAPKNSPRYSLKESSYSTKGIGAAKGFSDFFKNNPQPGCLILELGSVRVELWHLPMITTLFWSKTLLLDGSLAQMHDYVAVPLKGKFDVVFIDGRARISCIRRTYHDQLLAHDGWLFVHDAFRSEMAGAFALFNTDFTFIRGSNTTLSGEARCQSQFGPPYTRVGRSLDTLAWEIRQELFVYHNTNGFASTDA